MDPLLLLTLLFVKSSSTTATPLETTLKYEQPKKSNKYCDLTVSFNTKVTNGSIFYASNGNHSHYIALHMQDEYLIHKFNGGSGPAIINTKLTYNNEQQHKVVFSKNNSLRSLQIGTDNANLNTSYPSIRIDISVPFIFGELSPGMTCSIVETTLNIDEKFQHCLNNFEMNGKLLEKENNSRISACTEGTEEGTFFQGGYISWRDKYKVGFQMEIKMEIKPRNDSGLLLVVNGKKDFLILELINGSLKFTVRNKFGPFSTSFIPGGKSYWSDDKWHTIQMIRSKNVVTLSVDGTFTFPGVGDPRAHSTYMGAIVYIGSYRHLNTEGIITRTPFYGCIRNIEINSQSATITPEMKTGNVTLGSCPTN